MRKKLLGLCFLVGLAWTLANEVSLGCPPFFDPSTLSNDYRQASFVLVGRFANAKDNATGPATDFIIDQVLKMHKILKGPKVRKVNGKQVITLPQNIPETKNSCLIFFSISKDQIDLIRGVEVQPGSDLIHYLKGAVALKDAKPAERLRYHFKFLENKDADVAADAFLEFSKADFKDYKELARKLPAEKLAGWLRDPKTPPQKLGSYASLLGLCGTADHARLLRKLLDDPNTHKYGLDGVMVGYVSLEPRDGWKYVRSLLKDGQQEFLTRYTALRAVRFLRENRPDLISKKVLEEAMGLLLDQSDIADFAIEDLRKWKCWDMTDRILPLFGQKSHDIPVIKRSILRFAMQSPLTSAANFVQAQRSRDQDWVRDVEELLRAE